MSTYALSQSQPTARTLGGPVESLGILDVHMNGPNQSITQSSTQVQEADRILLVGDGNYIFTTAVPTIHPGYRGQILVVVNIDATHSFTFQDQSVLTGSGLALGAPTVYLGLGQCLTLVYSTVLSAWQQVNMSSASGLWTPTVTGVTNIAAVGTQNGCMYSRLGIVVTCAGNLVGIDPTAAGAASIRISLPIASVLGSAPEVAGCAASAAVASQSAQIIGDIVNDAALMNWVAVDTASRDWGFSFSYLVI